MDGRASFLHILSNSTTTNNPQQQYLLVTAYIQREHFNNSITTTLQILFLTESELINTERQILRNTYMEKN